MRCPVRQGPGSSLLVTPGHCWSLPVGWEEGVWRGALTSQAWLQGDQGSWEPTSVQVLPARPFLGRTLAGSLLPLGGQPLPSGGGPSGSPCHPHLGALVLPGRLPCTLWLAPPTLSWPQGQLAAPPTLVSGRGHCGVLGSGRRPVGRQPIGTAPATLSALLGRAGQGPLNSSPCGTPERGPRAQAVHPSCRDQEPRAGAGLRRARPACPPPQDPPLLAPLLPRPLGRAPPGGPYRGPSGASGCRDGPVEEVPLGPVAARVAVEGLVAVAPPAQSPAGPGPGHPATRGTLPQYPGTGSRAGGQWAGAQFKFREEGHKGWWALTPESRPASLAPRHPGLQQKRT